MEIKFRAWDKKSKKWLKECWISLYGYPIINIRSEHMGADLPEIREDIVELTQFTGLTDKNGKEIYEGDLVGEKDFYFEVTWDRGAFHIGNSQTLIEWLDSRSRKGFGTEVLGNIYENPELLRPNL